MLLVLKVLPFQAVCFLLLVLQCLSSGLLLVFFDFLFVFRSGLLLLVKILLSFAWFALCSQIPKSASSGLILGLKFSIFFAAVCSFVLKFYSPFRAVYSLFLDS